MPGQCNNPAVAHQRRRRYAGRSTANLSPTDIRRAPVDLVDPGKLSLSTLLGPRLRLPSRVTAAYQPYQLKACPSADRRRRLTLVHHQRSTPTSRLRNDLYCVGWGVKLYSLTHSLTDPLCGAAQPEVVSIYDDFMGRSSPTGRPCRGSFRTSGNQGDASSVTEPAVTSGASSPDAVPAEPEVEYHGAGSGVQSVPDRWEVVVFLPRNSLQQLLLTLRRRCPPP